MEFLRSILPAFLFAKLRSLKHESSVLTWIELQVLDPPIKKCSRRLPTELVHVKAVESAQPPEQTYVPFQPKRSQPIDMVRPRPYHERFVAPPLNFYWQPGKALELPFYESVDYDPRRLGR